jgi:hypothetical protein
MRSIARLMPIALLLAFLPLLEARLNQNPQNSFKPPSSDPPSAPPRPVQTPDSYAGGVASSRRST